MMLRHALWSTLTSLAAAAVITGSNGVTYTITQASGSSDIQFQVSGPTSGTGYAGVGIGSQMAGSLMFIVIPSSDGTAAVSLRSASGHQMPSTYTAASPVLSGVTNAGSSGTFNTSFTCTSCSTWTSGSLATYTSDGTTSFIWAQGAANGNSLSYHGDNYGIVRLNLAQTPTTVTTTIGGTTSTATAAATAAASTVATKSSGSSGSRTSSRPSSNWWIAHAAFVSVGFILVYGIGIVFAAFVSSLDHRIRYHYAIQIFGTVIGVIGIAFGIKYAGTPVEGAHQTLGIVLLALVFVQAALGTAQHMCFKKGIMSFPYTAAKYAHRVLGSVFLLGVVVNSGLGLLLPMVYISTGGVIAYYLVMFLLIVTYWVFRARILMSRPRPLDESKNSMELKYSNSPTSRYV